MAGHDPIGTRPGNAASWSVRPPISGKAVSGKISSTRLRGHRRAARGDRRYIADEPGSLRVGGRRRGAKRNSENCCPPPDWGRPPSEQRSIAITPSPHMAISTSSVIFSTNAEGGQIFSEFRHRRLQNHAGGMALRIPKAVQVALRKRTYNHQRRQPNVSLNSVVRRTDELDFYVDWSWYFFHFGGECPR